jgi:hypothetical protein
MIPPIGPGGKPLGIVPNIYRNHDLSTVMPREDLVGPEA